MAGRVWGPDQEERSRRERHAWLTRQRAAAIAELEELEQLERERRLTVDLRTHGRRRRILPLPEHVAAALDYKTDPRIIGAHEVEPVRCQCCCAIIPWEIIKGWRN